MAGGLDAYEGVGPAGISVPPYLSKVNPLTNPSTWSTAAKHFRTRVSNAKVCTGDGGLRRDGACWDFGTALLTFRLFVSAISHL